MSKAKRWPTLAEWMADTETAAGRPWSYRLMAEMIRLHRTKGKPAPAASTVMKHADGRALPNNETLAAYALICGPLHWPRA